MPYLTPPQVNATVAQVAACSAPGSRLVVNYQVRTPTAPLGRLLARALTASAGRRSFWADEPWRSTWTPAGLAEVLGRHGFSVGADTDLLAAATALGTVAGHRGSLRHGRVAVADRPR